LLYHEKLVLSQAAVAELEQLLGPKQTEDSLATEVENEEKPAAKKKPAKVASKRTRKPKEEAA
jgi:hypothetical protein